MTHDLRYTEILKTCSTFELGTLLATFARNIPNLKAMIRSGKHIVEDGIDLNDRLKVLVIMRELAEEEAALRSIEIPTPDRDLKPM